MAQSAKETVNGLIGLIIIGGGAYLYFTHDSHKAAATGAPPAAEDGTPVLTRPYPASEQQFLSVVAASASQYNAGSNDMAKGAARPARARALCQALGGSMTLQEPWIGTVSKLDTNGDGKGILEIKLAEGVVVATTNNALSDSMEHTLIDPNSNLFQHAVALHVGQQVSFRGSFLANETDCAEERSMTMEGSMTEPEFAMRFSDVRAVL